MRRAMARVLAGLAALLLWTAPAQAQSEAVEYYGLDALGSVRVIFDAQGTVVDRMDYGPFGENLRAAIQFPTDQFAQLQRDAESGQDYAQARNYSAGTGRFNRVDPVYAGLFDPQAWNRYAYALNAPSGLVDPTGRDPFAAAGLAVAGFLNSIGALDPNRSTTVTAPAGSDGMFEDDRSFGERLEAIGEFIQGVAWAVVDGILGTEEVGGPDADLAGSVSAKNPGIATTLIATVATVVVSKKIPANGKVPAAAAKVYHHTFERNLTSIRQSGLLPGAYATPIAGLRPLQAQLELALPPSSGLRNAVLEIDIQGLRAAGYEIPPVTRVSGQFGMPGGGYEMLFSYVIPPQFIRVKR